MRRHAVVVYPWNSVPDAGAVTLWGLPPGTGPTLHPRGPRRLPGGGVFYVQVPPGRSHDAIAGSAVTHSHLTHTNSTTLSNGQGPPGTTRHTGQPYLPSRARPPESKPPPCTKEGDPAARLMSDQPGRDPSALIKLLTQTGRPSEARLDDQCQTGQGRPGVGGPTSRRLAGAVPDCTHSDGPAFGSPAVRPMSDRPGSAPIANPVVRGSPRSWRPDEPPTGRGSPRLHTSLTRTGRPSEARLYDLCRTGQGRPRPRSLGPGDPGHTRTRVSRPARGQTT